ncbi:MAG TPA: response regulator [Archangium sp.]|nr:response regulator [Archangium sp.]
MPIQELEELLQQVVASQRQQIERPRIVVVDDDLNMRRSLETLLSDTYLVALASSATEGVAAVDEQTCAVVLDIKMKGYDGFWACSEIRKRYPDVPIIFYSAWQDLKDPYQIINEHRPFGYLTKDGDTVRLLDMLEAAVRIHRVTLYNKKLVEGLVRGRHSGG